MVATIFEAHKEIKNCMEQKRKEDTAELLSICQEAGGQIGLLLESIAEDPGIIGELEEYCVMLYQAYEQLPANPNPNIIFKQLNRQMIKIENRIKNYSEQYEAVFLPYKASMWDSMESVWKAAEKDKDCIAHVVPIPYYDKHTDGTLAEMHYEGDKYPQYVPVEEWETYNIQERKPDVIYMHNPYDNSNYVTSVHPSFYAETLKDYTDMLIYIPYFVAIYDVEPELCVTPAALYADKVIVQSEEVRKTYLWEFKKFEQENRCKGRFGNADSKFIAIGSPKFDKALEASENMIIPEAWKKILYTPEGRKKATVLYNTSLSALLDQTEGRLKKIDQVLRLFQNMDDFVLLWRPHPLSESTIAAMRPELLAEYQNLTNAFRTYQNGIYDDTEDLYRAIALSDFYYGDWSSVVVLYKLTGKPVFIQNKEVDFSMFF